MIRGAALTLGESVQASIGGGQWHTLDVPAAAPLPSPAPYYDREQLLDMAAEGETREGSYALATNREFIEAICALVGQQARELAAVREDLAREREERAHDRATIAIARAQLAQTSLMLADTARRAGTAAIQAVADAAGVPLTAEQRLIAALDTAAELPGSDLVVWERDVPGAAGIAARWSAVRPGTGVIEHDSNGVAVLIGERRICSVYRVA